MDETHKPLPTPEALLEQASQGGPEAALTARRAALLAERDDPALARRALTLVAKLEPLDPSPRLALARLHAEQGDVDAARAEVLAVFNEAIDQAARARAAFMLGEMARIGGDADEARTRFGVVIQIEENLLSADRSNPTAARWYARARGRVAELDMNAGAADRARAGAQGALAILRGVAAQTGETPVLAADIADAETRLGAMELDNGEPESALRRFTQAIGRYEALAVTEKQEPHWRAVLSDVWALAAEAEYVRGQKDRARDAMDRALQARIRLAAHHPEEAWALAGAWRLRAALRAALGDAAAATESLQQARALAETLCLRSGGADPAAHFLVRTLRDQADHALRIGDLNAAREAADQSRLRAEAQGEQSPAQAAWYSELGACWDRLGEVAHAAKSVGHAQDAFSRAVEFRRLACERDKGKPALERGLAAALLKLGDVALAANSPASARNAFHESTALRMHLFEAAPEDARAARALAASLERLGLAAAAMGDRNAARAAWDEELHLAERIHADHDSIEFIRFCAIVEAHLAGLGGAGSETHRTNALAGFDALAKAGVLTTAEAAARRKLWNSEAP